MISNLRQLAFSALLASVVWIPCAFGYINWTLTTTDNPPHTIQLKRTANTSIQFYLNILVVPGAQSSLSGAPGGQRRYCGSDLG